jgi:hypothetical protein
VEKGEYTSVTTLSYDEVDVSKKKTVWLQTVFFNCNQINTFANRITI